MNSLAVLMTCHNRKEKTLRSLNSFIRQEYLLEINYKIFVVDDGSNDGTSEAVKAAFPEINIIYGSGNLFWNRGMILAWEYASQFNFDYYLWLNDDTYLLNNAIYNLITGSKMQQDMSIIIGSTRSEYKSKLTYGGISFDNNLIEPNNELKIAHHFNGNIVLIPRYVFEKVGFLDRAFHHAIGDYDYGLRAKKLGIASYVACHICGMCEHHDELPYWCNNKYDFNDRFRDLYKSQCGTNPFQYFIFDRRHNGIFTAMFHFITINLRVIFPSLW